MKKRQFAVIGLGRFGAALARQLCSLGHEVLGIDRDGKRTQEACDLTHIVEADATDEDTLRDLGVRNFDAVVVAIGNDLQASILVTVLLKELGVRQVVAKAASEVHGRVLQKVGADSVVFPERDMGQRLANYLASANIVDYIELSPDYSIVEVQAAEFMEGKTLAQLNLRSKFGLNVMAIRRGAQVNVSPRADEEIHRGDVLVVIGANGDLRRLETMS